jgi:hypothetical protein
MSRIVIVILICHRHKPIDVDVDVYFNTNFENIYSLSVCR